MKKLNKIMTMVAASAIIFMSVSCEKENQIQSNNTVKESSTYRETQSPVKLSSITDNPDLKTAIINSSAWSELGLSSIDNAIVLDFSSNPGIRAVSIKDPNSETDFFTFTITNNEVSSKVIKTTYKPSQEYLDNSPILFEDMSVPYDGEIVYNLTNGEYIMTLTFEDGNPSCDRPFSTLGECIEWYYGQWYVIALSTFAGPEAFASVVLSCIVLL